MYRPAASPLPATSAINMPEHRVGDRQEVVVIPGDLARRFAECGDGEARHAQRPGRQQLLLDLARREHLLLEAALLGHLAEQRRHLAGHQVERFRQLAELIARAHRNLMAEVAGAHVLRTGKQIVHGAGDLTRQHEANRPARRTE